MNSLMKAKREAKKLTQLQLSQKVFVSEHYIYLIEAGERNPSVKLAKKIASELDFDWTIFYSDAEGKGGSNEAR